jgi:hypothetical protein
MLRLRFAAVGVSFWLTVLLTAPQNGLAQSVPGYRMRAPIGAPHGRHFGPSVRPPRLTGFPDGTLNVPGRRFRRHFVFPYQNFGWYFVGSDGYAYPDDSASGAYSMERESGPARDIYPVYDSVPDVGRLEVSSRHVASATVLRLTWRDHGVGATQVAFFLADSAKAVLSAQTDRSPPFTAQFEAPPGTRFAGMTLVLPNGNLVTQYVPSRRLAR